MGRVDVMLKKMHWLDEHRDWWLAFRDRAKGDYSVNLLEHTMDGVRKIYWRLPEKGAARKGGRKEWREGGREGGRDGRREGRDLVLCLLSGL